VTLADFQEFSTSPNHGCRICSNSNANQSETVYFCHFWILLSISEPGFTFGREKAASTMEGMTAAPKVVKCAWRKIQRAKSPKVSKG